MRTDQLSTAEIIESNRDKIHLLHRMVLHPEFHQRYDSLRIIGMPDNLWWGPSAAKTDEHGRVRRQFLKVINNSILTGKKRKLNVDRSLLTADDLQRAIERVGSLNDNFVIWMSWDDGVHLAWCLSSLNEIGVPFSAIQLAHDHHPTTRTLCSDNCSKTTRRSYEHACGVWRAFTSTSLIRFSRACQAAASDLKFWQFAEKCVFDFFPQFERGKLKISNYDKLVLEPLLRDQWINGIDWVKQFVFKNSGIRPWCRGDWAAFIRLNQWATHSDGKVVERQIRKERVSAFVRTDFRLTDFAAKLMRDVTKSIDLIPPYQIGGFNAYDPERLWVVNDGEPTLFGSGNE